MLAPVLDRLAWTEAIAGRPTVAEAYAEEGLRLAGEVGLDAGAALGSLALVSAMRGDEDGCRALAEQAYALAETRRMRIVSAAADWALGLASPGSGFLELGGHKLRFLGARQMGCSLSTTPPRRRP